MSTLLSASLAACLLLRAAAFPAQGTQFATNTSAQQNAAIYNAVPASAWTALSQAVGGRLHFAYPVAKPCYASYNGAVQVPDVTACKTVQSGYKTDTYLVTQPGGYLNTNWGTCQATDAQCALDYTTTLPITGLTCSQGSVAPRYIQVQKPSDIQAAMYFSFRTKVPLVIRNSGHDYKGRSSAPNSLMLYMNDYPGSITRNKAFVAQGCAASTAVDSLTFPSSTGFVDLYEYCEANACTVVGGSAETVRPGGGWITGAGHSSISNTLGLGVDLVVELTAVVGTGQVIVANRCQNSDLFFALRGGGGGSFGVITTMTTKIYPQMQIQAAYVRLASLSPANLQTFISICVQNAEAWAAVGYGGYIEPSAMSGQASGLVLFTPKVNNSVALAAMKPMIDYANSLGNLKLNAEVTSMPSFFKAYQTYLTPNEELVGLGTAIGSRLIPRANFQGSANQATLTATIVKIANLVNLPAILKGSPLLYTYGAPLQFLVTAPSGFTLSSNNTSPAGMSAVTPAWRNSLWHVFVNSVFSNSASTSDIAASFQRAHTAAEMLRAIAPNSGAYQNEADTFSSNPINDFWSPTIYPVLLKAKAKYDPQNLLTGHQTVGWNATDPRYNCYPAAPHLRGLPHIRHSQRDRAFWDLRFLVDDDDSRSWVISKPQLSLSAILSAVFHFSQAPTNLLVQWNLSRAPSTVRQSLCSPPPAVPARRPTRARPRTRPTPWATVPLPPRTQQRTRLTSQSTMPSHKAALASPHVHMSRVV
ncbi:uncharacterized protein L969DRAFT_93269 [Mixia osmundae IAM 14324]|uniref:FAD-binding PCMH-type domain-containing protein n=1 Tax=Mixia osmundae (strain CBS 9802 / IAM 14324 / JCM 22182 / KY 12970) TaxID=764103 RepID=G7E5K9_MIXOS|nr:uncharacterized protein L969DRAFT_93269 [Mixia osmundae IAM 14324]KEI40733.1 hypothetical protein L969DRAFT_93269 [Mixia osmundae IAM 14324]GAA98119.1 hypothetical protein E5Q_04802 [Mixia osmundae IAM 14324]